MQEKRKMNLGPVNAFGLEEQSGLSKEIGDPFNETAFKAAI